MKIAKILFFTFIISIFSIGKSFALVSHCDDFEKKILNSQLRGLVIDTIEGEDAEDGAALDVIINNIPMVDQGPKGYCAPATVERCMRFMGISADMYLLANIGKTSIGGGTSMKTLFGNIGRDIKRKGRSFDEYSGEIKIEIFKKYKLENAIDSHKDLEGRKILGPAVIIP